MKKKGQDPISKKKKKTNEKKEGAAQLLFCSELKQHAPVVARM